MAAQGHEGVILREYEYSLKLYQSRHEAKRRPSKASMVIALRPKASRPFHSLIAVVKRVFPTQLPAHSFARKVEV